MITYTEERAIPMTINSTNLNDTTLSPRHFVEGYYHVYNLVYGHAPQIRYVGNQWYEVNNELVHRTDLMTETARLHLLAREKQRRNTDKSMISRLISKLRGL